MIPIDPLGKDVDLKYAEVEVNLLKWTLGYLFNSIDEYWIGGSSKTKQFRYNVPVEPIQSQVDRVTKHLRKLLHNNNNKNNYSINFTLIERKLDQLRNVGIVFGNYNHGTKIAETVRVGFDGCIKTMDEEIESLCNSQRDNLCKYRNLGIEEFAVEVIRSKNLLRKVLPKYEGIKKKIWTNQQSNDSKKCKSRYKKCI